MPPDLAEEAAAVVKSRLPKTPQVAIILGSGLSAFAHTLADPLVVPYGDIPHFLEPTVPGHVGELVYGETAGLPVVVARGRFHYYEGHPLETVTLPVRLFARLGVNQLIITNAAGCVNTAWNVGDLMLLTGHLDYTFIDGLATPEVRDGAFHSPELLELARAAAHTAGVPLREGVYAWCLGPSFETPAEIRDIRRLGGAAVGMSTVPEIRAAAKEGLPTLAISALTNYAAGIRDQPLNHQEVLATGQRVKGTFAKLVTSILAGLRNEGQAT
ncbi:MAG: purine-nucleoside phosphorylase [Candidatus Marinimicrobia bacterium]|nr:purine-nucleoside phosphorylase [Candidatus Neomarinimicrobiota bacterium]